MAQPYATDHAPSFFIRLRRYLLTYLLTQTYLLNTLRTGVYIAVCDCMALFNMVNASKFHLHRDVLAASYWQFFGAFSAHFLWQPKWQSVTSKYTWILIDQTFVVQNLQMCLLYSLNSNINRSQWVLRWILSNQCCRFGKTAWLEETRVDVEDSSYITYLQRPFLQ